MLVPTPVSTLCRQFQEISGLTERCSEYEMEIRIIRRVRKPEILDRQLRPQCPEMDWTDKDNLSAHEAFCDVVSLLTN